MKQKRPFDQTQSAYDVLAEEFFPPKRKLFKWVGMDISIRLSWDWPPKFNFRWGRVTKISPTEERHEIFPGV